MNLRDPRKFASGETGRFNEHLILLSYNSSFVGTTGVAMQSILISPLNSCPYRWQMSNNLSYLYGAPFKSSDLLFFSLRSLGDFYLNGRPKNIRLFLALFS